MSEHAVPRYGTIDTDYGMQLATTAPDQDGPVWMVNLMKYRDVAEYADGRESSISGSEADDLYSPLDSLTAVGASRSSLATSTSNCWAMTVCGIASRW